MYRDPDAAAHLGQPSRRPAGPGSRVRVHRLERRRRRGLGRAAVPRLLARRDPLRADRPRGVLRLPGHAPEGPASSTAAAARSSGPRSRCGPPAPRAPRATSCSSTGPSRRCAGAPSRGAIVELAEALGDAARRDARRAAGRRPALAPGADHRPGHATRRSPTASALAARRPTRARPASSACCTRPARTRACRPRRCGRASRTTSPPPRTRRPRSRSCASSSALVGVSVDASELESAAADYERQVSLAVQSDPDVAAFVERLEAAAAGGGAPAAPAGPALGRRPRPRVPALPAPARPGRGLTTPEELDALAARLAAAGFVAAEEEAAELLARAAGDGDALDALVARRLTGEPLAWITGSVVFCGLEVRVDPGVYVPRPQTEPLARRAAERLPRDGAAIDLCTGCRGDRGDAGRAPPGRARRGVRRRRARGRLRGAPTAWRPSRGDLFAPLPPELEGAVDVVVGVVPYVPTPELGLLQRDTLAFESPLVLRRRARRHRRPAARAGRGPALPAARRRAPARARRRGGRRARRRPRPARLRRRGVARRRGRRRPRRRGDARAGLGRARGAPEPGPARVLVDQRGLGVRDRGVGRQVVDDELAQVLRVGRRRPRRGSRSRRRGGRPSARRAGRGRGA